MIVSADASSRMPLPAEPVLAADRPTVEAVAAHKRPDATSAPAAPEPAAPAPRTAKAKKAKKATVSRRKADAGAPSTRLPRAGRVPRVERMAVRPHKRGWQLSVAGVDDPAWVVDTKARALETAREAAAFHRCPLDVHGRNGAHQRTVQPPNQA